MSMYPKHLKYSNIIFRMTQHLFLKTLPLTFHPLLQRINMVGNLYLACIFIVLQFSVHPFLGRTPRHNLLPIDSPTLSHPVL